MTITYQPQIWDVRPDDAGSICNHFSPEQISELIVLLADEKVKQYSDG